MISHVFHACRQHPLTARQHECAIVCTVSLQGALKSHGGESLGTSGVLPGPKQIVKQQIDLQDFQKHVRDFHRPLPFQTSQVPAFHFEFFG